MTILFIGIVFLFVFTLIGGILEVDYQIYKIKKNWNMFDGNFFDYIKNKYFYGEK